VKHISILVPESAVLDSITAPRYLFTAVNQFLAAAGKPPLFDLRLVGLTKEIRLHDGLFTVHPDALIGEVKKNRPRARARPRRPQKRKRSDVRCGLLRRESVPVGVPQGDGAVADGI